MKNQSKIILLCLYAVMCIVVVALSGCGVLRKASTKHVVTTNMDSASISHATNNTITIITGDSVVQVPEAYITQTIDWQLLDTSYTDSFETEDVKLVVHAAPAVIVDGVQLRKKLVIKAVRKAQQYYPNYNYYQEEAIATDDSVLIKKTTADATITTTKKRDTRLIGIAVLIVSVLGVGFLLNKFLPYFKTKN